MATLQDFMGFWESFWAGFDDDPDKIEEIEGLMFRNKRGEWFAAMVPPNAVKPIMIQVYFNPWTGEELR